MLQYGYYTVQPPGNIGKKKYETGEQTRGKGTKEVVYTAFHGRKE